MSRLTIYAVDAGELPSALRDTRDAAEIAGALADIGVRFERWPAAAELPLGAAPQAVLDAYVAEIDRLKGEGGYRTADVIRLPRGAPNGAELRTKFLDEHTHGEDEVRFFVEGAGAFYLRPGDGNRVFRVICERDDLISVPAGMRHWFDMGPDPEFAAVRLFTNESGWVAQFTGDAIAKRVPGFDAA